jgi:DNA-binding NarL/FixJ family response regulator
MTSSRIAVLIVSDVRLYRDGILELLDGADASAIDGSPEAVLGAIERHAPDVVLLDAGLPHSLLVARAIRARAGSARVIVISVPDGDALRFAEAGIAGYVTRDGSVTELRAAIASVGRRERLSAPEPLTAREQEILQLITAGLSNKEIAAQLVIGVATVKTHVHNILRKLGARRRGQAAARARVDAHGLDQRMEGELDPLVDSARVMSRRD